MAKIVDQNLIVLKVNRQVERFSRFNKKYARLMGRKYKPVLVDEIEFRFPNDPETKIRKSIIIRDDSNREFITVFQIQIFLPKGI